MYVNQVGLKLVSSCLFSVPPCPAGSVFKYVLLTWGENLILHFLEAETGLVSIQAPDQLGLCGETLPAERTNSKTKQSGYCED